MKKHTLTLLLLSNCRYLLFILVVLLVGCSIDDNRDECPDDIWVTFKYKYASQQKKDLIDQLDLFAFDEKGVLCLHETGYVLALDGNFRKRITLPSGKYTFIAWAGLSDESTYLTSDMVIGKTRMDEVQVQLLGVNNSRVDFKPGILLFGKVPDYTAQLKKNPEVVIPMITDNNQINVKVRHKGVKAERRENLASIRLEITDNNSVYTFDNQINRGTEEFVYTPFLNKETLNSIDCSFYVLKLQDDGYKPMLKLKNVTSDEIIIEEDLVALIRKVNEIYGEKIDLERDTVFNIELELDSNNVIITLVINGWVLIQQGAVVG